jgi:diamine N-acetyltransferase
MELIIRKAGKEQAALLAQLGAKTFYDAFANQNTEEDMEQYLRTHFTPGLVAAEFDEPGVQFYMAYMGAEVIGYIKTGAKTKAALAGKKTMELERLYLLESYHGKGFGRQMLQHCIDAARAEGYQVLWLGVWEHNPKAIGLYMQAGFQKFGEHIFQLGSDAQTDTLMKLELTANT